MAGKVLDCWTRREVVSPDMAADLRQTCPVVPKAGLREPFAVWDGAASLLEPARSIASGTLGRPAHLTRAILFDKPPGRNWILEVHQDLTIAVMERVEAAEGFGPWSRKRGAWHCEAPVEVLRRMLTVRVHLDDADEDNGCLLAAPVPEHLASHKLSPDDLQACVGDLIPMPAKAGDAVVMRPLTPHASARNTTDRHRRVLHMEFAAGQPGQGLRWRDEDEILGRASPTRP